MAMPIMARTGMRVGDDIAAIGELGSTEGGEEGGEDGLLMPLAVLVNVVKAKSEVEMIEDEGSVAGAEVVMMDTFVAVAVVESSVNTSTVVIAVVVDEVVVLLLLGELMNVSTLKQFPYCH
jgi:hypothetical protein